MPRRRSRENVPDVGELVTYHVDAHTAVSAVVEAVTFWDVVTLRLPTGETLRDVRRVVQYVDEHDTLITECYVGRWDLRPLT